MTNPDGNAVFPLRAVSKRLAITIRVNEKDREIRLLEKRTDEIIGVEPLAIEEGHLFWEGFLIHIGKKNIELLCRLVFEGDLPALQLSDSLDDVSVLEDETPHRYEDAGNLHRHSIRDARSENTRESDDFLFRISIR